MKIERSTVTFSSGRERYCHRGIFGLSPELHVTHGYDGGFWDGIDVDADGKGELTVADLNELADHMIERWQAFKKRLTAEADSPNSPSHESP